jgi:arylsulfatase A-like enzyme
VLSSDTKTRAASAVLLALAALLPLGCGGEEVSAPDFACAGVLEGFEPQFPDQPFVVVDEPNQRVEVVLRGGRPMYETTYRASAWRPTPLDGCFVTDVCVPVMLVDDGYLEDSSAFPDGQALWIDGELAELVATPLASTALDARRPGTWGTVEHLVGIQVAPGAPAPREVVLRVPIPIGAPQEDSWRVLTARWSGDGFTCLPGVDQLVDLPAGEGRVLHFAWFAALPVGRTDATAARLEVRANGEALWHVEVASAQATLHGELRFARVAVPDGVETLSVRQSGGVALFGLLEPRAVTGASELREGATHDGRPNLVLFSADTLRADAFELHRRYATSPQHTFETLEAFAARSVAFENAWSASSWTLPSHTALLAGVHPNSPPVADSSALPRGLTTVAEHLRAAGYRTLAITDAGIMSIDAAFDQGFDVFDQAGRGMSDRLARANAALASHDGRPTFVFVHTFAVHAPYLPSAAARLEHGLPDDLQWTPIAAETEALVERREDQAAPRGRELLDAARRLYWSEVADLDTDFGVWLDAYARHGWADGSTLIFTSDHGESFGEHGHVQHLGELYETQNRVPLFVLSPHLAPRRRSDAAGGVDVAATLLAVAGIAVPESWPGRSLLVEQPGVAWSTVGAGGLRGGTQVTLTDGRTKLFANSAANERFAHALSEDPDELVRRPFEVDRALFERFERESGAVLAPEHALTEEGDAPSGLLGTLENLGYVDEKR